MCCHQMWKSVQPLSQSSQTFQAWKDLQVHLKATTRKDGRRAPKMWEKIVGARKSVFILGKKHIKWISERLFLWGEIARGLSLLHTLSWSTFHARLSAQLLFLDDNAHVLSIVSVQPLVHNVCEPWFGHSFPHFWLPPLFRAPSFHLRHCRGKAPPRNDFLSTFPAQNRADSYSPKKFLLLLSQIKTSCPGKFLHLVSSTDW